MTLTAALPAPRLELVIVVTPYLVRPVDASQIKLHGVNVLSITDPPVKLLRRLIPQLTIGAVRFDLSIMVLLLVAFIGMQLAFGAAA